MYECERCGYVSERKGDLIKHLNKKKECSPLNSSTSREDLISKLQEKNNKSNSQCKSCGKILNNRSNLWRHMKTCKVKASDDELQELTKLISKYANTQNIPEIINGISNILLYDERYSRIDRKYIF